MNGRYDINVKIQHQDGPNSFSDDIIELSNDKIKQILLSNMKHKLPSTLLKSLYNIAKGIPRKSSKFKAVCSNNYHISIKKKFIIIEHDEFM